METHGNVVEIWRYPVKSLLGERLDNAVVGADGIEGDRRWSLVETASGRSLTARKRPELLTAQAAMIDGDTVLVTLPDGTEVGDDESLSRWLGIDVELRRASPDTAGTFETQADLTETGDWFTWTGPTGSFHDSARTKVSLLSMDTLGAWDRRRFRINIITDGTGEDALVGSEITVGSAVRLQVKKQIDRCVMVTRPQPGVLNEPPLERDLDVLKTINNERDGFLGIGALVETGGTIRSGDTVAGPGQDNERSQDA